MYKRMPCLQSPLGLEVLPRTADQRFKLDPNTFSSTHMPMKLWRDVWKKGSDPHRETVGEQDLLAELLQTKGVPFGNRIYVLYGSTGSGKSELSKWLETKIQQQDGARRQATIRISRTELDIVKIAERFKKQLDGMEFQANTHESWQRHAEKPSQLAHLLLTNALYDLDLSDELYHKLMASLIKPVERNLAQTFQLNVYTEEDARLELLSREDFTIHYQGGSHVEYEKLRQALVRQFEETILEGFSLMEMLRRISDYVYTELHTRPVLLIDDIVQSLNLFATDLLDLFLDLDSGNWDVVIGITPASLESNQRGKDLLQRLRNLDTVQDRIYTYSLSDERGSSSSFLTEDTVVDYMKPYLVEFKKRNGISSCSSCSHFKTCQVFGTPEYAPFNEPLLRRMFGSIDHGHGKARYMILKTFDILNDVINHDVELLDAIGERVESELTIDHPTRSVQELWRFYAPELMDDGTTILPGELLQLFELGQDQIEVPYRSRTISGRLDSGLEDLENEEWSVNDPSTPLSNGGATTAIAMKKTLTPVKPMVDLNRAELQAWKRGKEVNKELLLPLRKAISNLVSPFFDMTELKRYGSIRSVLVYSGTVGNETNVTFEGLDEKELSLVAPRQISETLYIDMLTYQKSWEQKDEQRAEELRLRIVSNPQFSLLLERAISFHERLIKQMQDNLGVQVDLYVYAAYVIVHWLDGKDTLDLDSLKNGSKLKFTKTEWPQELGVAYKSPSDDQRQLLTAWFKEWFQIRENLYDAQRIQEFQTAYSITDLLKVLRQAKGSGLERYRFKTKTETALTTLVQSLQKYLEPLEQLKRYPHLARYIQTYRAAKELVLEVKEVSDWRRLTDSLIKATQIEKQSQPFRLMVSDDSYQQAYAEACQQMKWIDDHVLSGCEDLSTLNEIELAHFFFAFRDFKTCGLVMDLQKIELRLIDTHSWLKKQKLESDKYFASERLWAKNFRDLEIYTTYLVANQLMTCWAQKVTGDGLHDLQAFRLFVPEANFHWVTNSDHLHEIESVPGKPLILISSRELENRKAVLTRFGDEFMFVSYSPIQGITIEDRIKSDITLKIKALLVLASQVTHNRLEFEATGKDSNSIEDHFDQFSLLERMNLVVKMIDNYVTQKDRLVQAENLNSALANSRIQSLLGRISMFSLLHESCPQGMYETVVLKLTSILQTGYHASVDWSIETWAQKLKDVEDFLVFVKVWNEELLEIAPWTKVEQHLTRIDHMAQIKGLMELVPITPARLREGLRFIKGLRTDRITPLYRDYHEKWKPFWEELLNHELQSRPLQPIQKQYGLDDNTVLFLQTILLDKKSVELNEMSLAAINDLHRNLPELMRLLQVGLVR